MAISNSLYFQQFPTLFYNFGSDSESIKILVTNIFKRVRVKHNLKENSNLYYVHVLEQGETPELLAAKVYDDPNLHWVLLLVNNVVNPLFDWCLDDITLENLVRCKYPGHALLLYRNRICIDYSNANVVGTFDNSNSITQGTGGGEITAFPIYNDTRNSKLWIYSENNSNIRFSVGTPIEQKATNASISGDFTISSRPDFDLSSHETIEIVSGGDFASGSLFGWYPSLQKLVVYPVDTGEFYQTANCVIRGTTSNTYAKVFKSSLNIDSVHHYVNSNGQEVSRDSQGSKEDGGDYWFSWGGEDHYLGTYEVMVDGVGPVSNFDYERARNESRREVVVLHPRFIPDFIAEFQSLIQK